MFVFSICKIKKQNNVNSVLSVLEFSPQEGLRVILGQVLLASERASCSHRSVFQIPHQLERDTKVRYAADRKYWLIPEDMRKFLLGLSSPCQPQSKQPPPTDVGLPLLLPPCSWADRVVEEGTLVLDQGQAGPEGAKD